MIINITKIVKHFGSKILFDKASFVVHKGDRIALTGQNGTGKSTLINCISGKEEFDGTIDLGHSKISIMEQENVFAKENATFLDYLKDKQDKLEKLKEKYDALFGDTSIYEDMDKFDKLNQEYQSILSRQTEKIEEDKIKKLLHLLSFEMKDYNKKIIDLSGGQRTKLRIAECLSKHADLYILDEPTNHIDFETLKWLEQYLLDKVQTFIVVSHDRFFLKRTVNKVIEIENKVCKEYKCKYLVYLLRRKKHLKSLAERHSVVAREKKRLLDSAKEKRRWAQIRGSKQLKILADGLERRASELPDIPNPDEFMQSFQLKFDPAQQPSKTIFKLKELKKSFGEQVIFENVSFEIFKGEKIGIVGGNGSGKTTLLKILANLISFDSGDSAKGLNLMIGYFDQEFKDVNLNQQVMKFLRDSFVGLQEHHLISLAVKFGFPRDKLKSKISVLSGGERARLNFIRLTVNKCNVLLLDEPTNNLDLELREVLELALRRFTGTVIFVSHDRYFIKNVAEKLLVIENKSVREVSGDFLF
jgi:ATP-binding cassette, subfamily F, member 3